MEIPTIDIAQFPGDDDFVAVLGEGYEQFGFCGIVGHGIGDDVINDAYGVMQEFFALPKAVKERYRTGTGGARGYTSFGIETAKDSQHPDLKEFWQLGRELSDDELKHDKMFANLWPVEVQGFKPKLYRLYQAMDQLGNRILDALAIYLGLPSRYFQDKVNHGNSILRPLHYPPITDPETPAVRSAAHEDINLITLLVGSEQAGLEILAHGSQWIPVHMMPGTIVVNIGDMMQRLTNHVLPSTTHRVVNAADAYGGHSRYSIPFFLHPNPEFEIATLPGCISADRPNRYPQSISADDYLTERLIEIGLL